MTWILWAALLIAQNFSFTVVGRARNSGSDAYHAIAAVFSNGIWFVQMFFVFDVFDTVRSLWAEGGVAGWLYAIAGALFYITFTVIGSVYGGRIARTFFEKGNRRVGYYEDKKVAAA